jgi:hypothetical protein
MVRVGRDEEYSNREEEENQGPNDGHGWSRVGEGQQIVSWPFIDSETGEGSMKGVYEGKDTLLCKIIITNPLLYLAIRSEWAKTWACTRCVRGSEGSEAVEVVWSCLVLSVDSLFGSVLFPNPFQLLGLPSACLSPSRQAPSPLQRCWTEEVLLIREEMWRVIAFHHHMALQWESWQDGAGDAWRAGLRYWRQPGTAWRSNLLV